MQRQAINASELKPSARQHVGAINAEKCIIYLRGIGVEIDDATADAWLDTQAAYRFLRSERAWVRRVRLHCCRCGEMQGYTETGRKAVKPPKLPKDRPRTAPKCESCGTGFIGWRLLFAVRRDGSVEDHRRGADAVIPLRLDEFAGGLCS